MVLAEIIELPVPRIIIDLALNTHLQRGRRLNLKTMLIAFYSLTLLIYMSNCFCLLALPDGIL